MIVCYIKSGMKFVPDFDTLGETKMKTPKISSLNDDQLATLAKEISAEMERRENAKIKIRKGDTFDVKKHQTVTVSVHTVNETRRFDIGCLGTVRPYGKIKVLDVRDETVLALYSAKGSSAFENLPDGTVFEMQKKEFFDAFMS